MKFESASLHLLPAQADNEHEVILNVLACIGVELFADGVVLEAEPEVEAELFANEVAALTVGAVAGRVGVVLTGGEGDDVGEAVRDETKKYAAGEATGNVEPLVVSVGGRKDPMGSEEESGVLGGGTVERVEDPAIIADVCGPGPARDHGDGTPNPLILQALGDQAR